MRRRAIDAPAGVRSDLEILRELADRLGRGQLFPTDPREVYAELCRASSGGTADYTGITYDRLTAGEELFWPCPAPTHPGTPRMFLESFPTTDGRARFVPVTPERPRERPNAEFPYLLTTGRSRGHYQSGAQTRRSPTLQGAEPEAYAELHPELAAAIGVADRAHVRLRTRRGNVVLRARLTPGIRRDTVFVPFHWGGESGANALTNAALDPTSRMPEFKTCPVAVESTDTSPDRPGDERAPAGSTAGLAS